MTALISDAYLHFVSNTKATLPGYPLSGRLSLREVREVLSDSPVVWINGHESCALAAQIMSTRNIGLLPVLDARTNTLVGVITDRDLVLRVAAKGFDAAKTQVSSEMTSPFIAVVFDDADLMTAERLMIQQAVRRLVVLRRKDHAVIGILSVDDFALAGYRRRAGEIIRGTSIHERSESPALVRKGEEAPTGAISQPTEESFNLRESAFKVADVMSRGAEWILETDTCRDAAVKMMQCSIGWLPVSNIASPKALNGIITDRDIVIRVLAKNLSPKHTLVRDIMSKPVVCCSSNHNLVLAEQLMMEHRVRRLPVLDCTTNALIGVISIDDIALLASRGRAGRVIQYAAHEASDAPLVGAAAVASPKESSSTTSM